MARIKMYALLASSGRLLKPIEPIWHNFQSLKRDSGANKGTEPKGILIVSKASDSEPEPLTKEDFKSELAEYAKKKNVCLMTTMQLLSIYKEVALDKGDFDKVREKMSESSGWLEGFKLEPGELMEEEEEIVVEGKRKRGSLIEQTQFTSFSLSRA